MFTGSQQIIIGGGTFLYTSTSKGFKILHGKVATDAFHDSRERFDPPRCHPNTRAAILAEIMRWIQAVEVSEHILWLYGSAGVGKSAIAQTIAELCSEHGLTVASFFFYRGSQSRNNEKRLISSIAYQLALSIPATRPHIESAVQIDPTIFDRSLDTQIKTLIIRPLKNASADVNPAVVKQWPRLIIIDGLDECNDPSIQCSIIRLLSNALRCVPVPLILLVASRPEPHIRHTFNLMIRYGSHASRHIVLDDSYESDVDIRKFLVSRFKEIKAIHQLAAFIPESWPSEEIVDQLVQKSSGQFIYASTVMKYLDSPKHRPTKRLDAIMGSIPVMGDMPYKELDALYSYIFSCVENFGITLKILGFLFFLKRYQPLTPKFLALLLGLDEEDVYLCLSDLHSILYIPPLPNASGLEIRSTHASLQDFLVDKLRSGEYYLDEEVFHTDLAKQCVRQISTLSMNQALEGVSGLEQYLTHSFIYHCTHASTNSADLKNSLLQLCNLQPWFDIVRSHRLLHLSSLFSWLYKADTADKELSRHIQSLWDQYLTTELSEHTFNGSNVDIAGLLFFPYIWNSRWFYLISGVSRVPNILRWHLDSYQPFLIKFFEDKTRSGRYHVDGTVYANAALECFRNMFNPNDDEIFSPYTFILGISRPDTKSFTSITEDIITSQREIFIPWYNEGLDAVTTLLSKAAPVTDLYLYLRDHPLQNPAKAKVHCEHGFASLRLAVKVYLGKCKDLVPKALRRSASCPLFSTHVDLELNIGTTTKAFNQRWPLAMGRSGHWSPIQANALADMRALPELMALRERRNFKLSR